MSTYPQTSAQSLQQIQYLQQNHPAYANHINTANPNLVDYSAPPGPPQNSAYHPSVAHHYAAQLPQGYNPTDQHQQHTFQPTYEYDHQAQINHQSYYGAPGSVGLGPDQSGQGNPLTTGLQSANGFNQYAQLPPQQHYQQNLSIDPSAQAAGYPYHHQFHAHHGLQNYPQNGGQPQLDQQNYMAFGQANQNQGGFGQGYLAFNSGVPPTHPNQIHSSQYGIMPQPVNQISGLTDPHLTALTTLAQQNIGKTNIKNEDQPQENELGLASHGDSLSQNEEKLKANQQYLLQQQYELQHNHAYYHLDPSFGMAAKKDEFHGQNQYFQGYPPHPFQGQPPYALAQIPAPIQSRNPQVLTKEKEDPSKQQPISPGRKKTIKKGSPTTTTEPSSPASPRGRKRKNTLKAGEIPPQQLDNAQNQNTPLLSANNLGQQQFGLHLVKVQNQDQVAGQQQQLGYPGSQQIYQHLQNGQLQGVIVDQQTKQITGIDNASFNMLKGMTSDCNLNDLALFEDKQIGMISKELRNQKIKIYQEKRKRRSWMKKISYDVRKKVADGRLRVKGRFVTKVQAMEMLDLNGKEDEFTMEDIKKMLKIKIGDEDSPKLTSCRNLKKSQSMPATEHSLKQGGDNDDDEEDDDDLNENLSEGILGVTVSGQQPISRRKSCVERKKGEVDYFHSITQSAGLILPQQPNDFFLNNQNHPQTHHGLLKQEQKEAEHNNKHFNLDPVNIIQQGQQQQQQQVASQLFSTSQSSTSRSPSRSPRKLATQSSLKLVDGIVSQSPTIPSQGNVQNQFSGFQNNQELKNNPSEQEIEAQQASNNFASRSNTNIQSQEIAEQFLKLQIKSPELTHIGQPALQNQPAQIALTEVQTGLILQNNESFFNPSLLQNQSQNQNYQYLMYAQQQFNAAQNSNSSVNNSQSYAIHQQQ